jgi:TPR repeat protein
MRPDDALSAAAEAALQTACNADDPAACNDLGVVLHLRGQSPSVAAAARTALDRACKAELEPACRNLERLR